MSYMEKIKNKPIKIFAVNGSPRSTWNTAQLCEAFLDGAKSADPNVEVELIHLGKYNFKGCISCYACKRDNEKTYGRCNYKDEILPVIEEISQADGILFASPIYFGEVSSLMRAFMERLFYPWNTYEKGWKHIAPKKLETTVIYDMTIPEEMMENSGYAQILEYFERCIGRFFEKPERLLVYDTMQFNDYSKYKSDLYDVDAKKKRHEEIFPQDCQKAYEMGKRQVEKILGK